MQKVGCVYLYGSYGWGHLKPGQKSHLSIALKHDGKKNIFNKGIQFRDRIDARK
jgi:hypothetical protein